MNDLLKVLSGEVVPVDGEVIYGKGICNESTLTGEAKSINKEIGSKIFGGSIL